MSVTTSQRFDQERFEQLVAGPYEWTGELFNRAGAKTITGLAGVTDATITNAVTSAAAFLAQSEQNKAAVLAAARNALTANAAYLALPTVTNAQVVAQVAALTRQVNGLIRLAVSDFTATT